MCQSATTDREKRSDALGISNMVLCSIALIGPTMVFSGAGNFMRWLI
jgi:hypothetical protein